MRLFTILPWSALVSFAICLLAGCSGADHKQTVVVYTAHDRGLSEPILDAFERETGIRVIAVYDAEEAKTTGIINRLLTRRDNPDADVLWNNEIVQTIRLAREGLFEAYESPNAARFPERYRDAQSRWTGFAGRLRLVIVNTDRLSGHEPPTSTFSLTDATWKEDSALAKPLFGTTLTHFALLHAHMGEDAFRQLLSKINSNGVAIAPGNGAVRDLVARGELAWGLTDTDDAWSAMERGDPVDVRVVRDEFGPILIPNTAALIKGGPNTEAGKRLIDHLLSADTERDLAEGRAKQIPLGKDLADLRTPWSDLLDSMPDNDFEGATSVIQETIEIIRNSALGR